MNYAIIGLFKIALLMFPTLCRRTCLSLLTSEQWRKKWLSDLKSDSRGEIGLRTSKKLCLNLSSLKKLSPTQSLVKKTISFMLQVSLTDVNIGFVLYTHFFSIWIFFYIFPETIPRCHMFLICLFITLYCILYFNSFYLSIYLLK